MNNQRANQCHGVESFLSSEQFLNCSRYGARRLISVFTKSRQFFLSWARLSRPKISFQIRQLVMNFVTRPILTAKSFQPLVQNQSVEPPFVGCPKLLIKYIRGYPPYLRAVSSIHNLKPRHAITKVQQHGDRNKAALSILKHHVVLYCTLIFGEVCTSDIFGVTQSFGFLCL